MPGPHDDELPRIEQPADVLRDQVGVIWPADAGADAGQNLRNGTALLPDIRTSTTVLSAAAGAAFPGMAEVGLHRRPNGETGGLIDRRRCQRGRKHRPRRWVASGPWPAHPQTAAASRTAARTPRER